VTERASAAPWKDSRVAFHTARTAWLGLAIVVGASCISACGSTGASSADKSTTAKLPSVSEASTDPIGEQSVCAEIDQRFYFPTVPAGGYTVTRSTASDIEHILQHAQSPDLQAEAGRLERAIEADNESAMVSAILHVQNSTCAASGTPPAT
jgi:hypothetical protein